MKRFQLMFVMGALVTASMFTQTSQAHPYVSFGIRLGGPYYYGRPYYYGYPYYYPGPAVIYGSPPPVIINPAPVVVQAPPVSVPVPVPPTPNPYVPPTPSPYAPPTPGVVPTQGVARPVTRMDSLLQQLSDANDSARRDAAMDLGRMKAQRAVDPLMNMLAKDTSPAARDGAARALGLIGSPRSLQALIYAAQADPDRDVRHSAQFAVEIIRTNLRN